MGRLTNLAPVVGHLAPRLARRTDAHGHDPVAQPSRAWMNSTRWRKLRLKIFERDLYTCQWKGCGVIIADTSQLRADHIIPHRGDEALFWDEANLQTLCQPCHDSRKQAAERRGLRP